MSLQNYKKILLFMNSVFDENKVTKKDGFKITRVFKINLLLGVLVDKVYGTIGHQPSTPSFIHSIIHYTTHPITHQTTTQMLTKSNDLSLYNSNYPLSIELGQYDVATWFPSFYPGQFSMCASYC